MIYPIGVHIANLEKLYNGHFVVSEKEAQKLTSMEVTLFDEALFSQVRVSRNLVVMNVKSADVHSACGRVRSSIIVPRGVAFTVGHSFQRRARSAFCKSSAMSTC